MRKLQELLLGTRRAVVAATVLFAGLALAAPLTPVAQAALDGCRSDPVIYLSDGSALDVTADINTSVANITGIAYYVHVPRGVRALLVVTTPTLGFKGKEVFVLLNDAPAGQYQTDTFVQTSNGGVGVTAQTSLVGVYLAQLGLSLQSQPAYGYSGNHVWTTVYR